MIKISLEESECFDRLSILEIKEIECQNADVHIRLQQQINDLQEEINIGIGRDLAAKIYCSPEYTALYNANFAIFNGVERATRDAITAFRLNCLNVVRTEKKKELQKVFFGSNSVEVKL